MTGGVSFTDVTGVTGVSGDGIDLTSGIRLDEGLSRAPSCRPAGR